MIEIALKYDMWGHRKVAWQCRDERGVCVCAATCLWILREAGLTLPVDYVAERRDLAGARRAAFVELPTRRNRVWQMDFFELETSGAGTWRSGDVIDYATKLVLAGPVTADPDHPRRDRLHPRRRSTRPPGCSAARCLKTSQTPARVSGRRSSWSPTPARCFKSAGFARFIYARPGLRHIRTRRRSPQTNDVIERYHGAIKIEALWRDLPAYGAEMTTVVEDFRRLFNEVRPHETPGRRPTDRALPRRPRHHRLRPRHRTTPNVPNHADSLTRHNSTPCTRR